jgi:hypothetical protein
MLLSRLPALVATTFLRLAYWLDRRSAARLPQLLLGILLASGRRTCTSWFRAAGITDDFRPTYALICTVGQQFDHLAISMVLAVKPLLDRRRLLLGIDDTPTARYGPQVEGAGRHHNPSPGPAGEKYLYGHNWVVLTALGQHPNCGTLALPLQAQLYIRQTDLAKLDPDRRRPFHTKLELAGQQLHWAKLWVGSHFEERWVVVDGGYSKKPFLASARQAGFIVVGRLRKDAALWSLPLPKKPSQPGPAATYGKERYSLAKRAAHKEGWQQVECVQYGKTVTKTIKTFLATWRPAGGAIRVVLVKEDNGWIPFFCTKTQATVQQVLEAAADRNALEQMNKDAKEVWGAGQQQVRNVHSNEGCFNLNLWLYSVVEVWAWDKPQEQVVDRSASPWDKEPRRASHADKRKALQREVLRQEIEAVLSEPPNPQRYRDLAEKLLALAV